MQLPRADRWGQPDFEGYISVSDGFPEEDDEPLVQETDVEEQPEPTLVQTPPDNSCRHIVEAIAAPPPPPPPELAELEECQELQDENAEEYAEEYATQKCVEEGPEATSQTLSHHCNEIRPLVFHRMLLDLAAEYNRVLAKLQHIEEPLDPQELEHESTLEHVDHRASTDRASTGDSLPAYAPVSRKNTRRTSGSGVTLAVAPVIRRATFSELALGERLTSFASKTRTSPFDINDLASTHSSLERAVSTPYLKDFMDQLWARRRSTFALCEKICDRRLIDVLSSFVIISNAVLYGWVANAAVAAAFEGQEIDGYFDAISLCFTIWFCFEFAVRVWTNGCKKYFCSQDDWSWNAFDTFMVFIDVILTVFEHVQIAGDTQQFLIMRMLRILRILRAVRFVRLFRFVRELRMMVSSILRSGSSLFWSLILLGLTIYAFAIYFMHVVSDHIRTQHSMPDGDITLLYNMFGNLVRAEYTLYMCVCGGISWGEVNRLLIQISFLHGTIFCFFTFFTTFALLNIITGIFVETSINSARSTREEVAQEQMKAKSGFLEEMKRLFKKADKDRSGTMTLAEFELVLSSKEVRAYLDALGIEVDKAKGLFQLLDLDMSGEISIDEFTFGCNRLKGGAKSIDLATLMMHSRRMSDQWQRFFTWSESQFKRLHEFESRVEERLAWYASALTPAGDH